MDEPLFSAFPELRSSRFVLRRILPADRPAIFSGLSDPQVIVSYGVSYTSLDETQQQMDWFERIYANSTGIWWGVCRPDERGLLLGALGLNDLHAAHRRAEIGCWLLPAHWGKGIARECVSAVVSFAFGPMGLHRLGADVDVDNVRSASLLKRLGFQLEGIRRGYELKAGSWLDLHCYSLLSTDDRA